MRKLKTSQKPKLVVLHPRPEHFGKIQDLCKLVYPFSKPWSIEQLESHRSYFPDGQLIVIDKESGRLVGMAFSLVVAWNDYLAQDSWKDFTSSGYFRNHDPRKGKTLYGAEVMVDPEMRGMGIGRLLYEHRKLIVEKYGLKRIRAGARLRGYSKFKDKLTPDEYVKQVVEKKIFDPTLSFQLNQGFKVIDVAPNYLFNDPESLGYAAVIEWLNPKTNTDKDVEKQSQSSKAFLSGEKFVSEFMPIELRRLVRKATYALGSVIKETEGDAFFARVEYYREQLKRFRNRSDKARLLALLKQLRGETKADRLKLAHAFSLQLELVNVCESAYRTWRQRLKPVQQGLKTKTSLTYVLTAHPTEARSKVTLEEISDLTKILLDGVQSDFLFNENEMQSKLRMLWLHPFSKAQSPSVIDEADYIYSIIFSENLFDFILTEKPSYDIKLRTWVGGDKDGHPGVNKTVMRDCFIRSRKQLIRIVEKKLESVIKDEQKLESVHGLQKIETKSLTRLMADLIPLRTVAHGDGSLLKAWIMKYRRFIKGANIFVQKHHQILLINRMLEVFPALVFPIELREDAGLIRKAISDENSVIRGMLSELAQIAGALNVTAYAKCIVVSHCENAEDLSEACKLVRNVCHSRSLKVVPLFETKEALISAKKILRSWLGVKANLELATTHWNKSFEVMLGYSDSAKQIGSLPSRYLIAKAMSELEREILNFGLKPIFFHGSGGSVARGGGSLKEQIAWWSDSAVTSPKFTIQGEMIQRQFATKEILNSQCVHLATEAMRRRARPQRMEKNPALDRFVHLVSDSYSKLIGNQDILKELLDASPFNYLDVLKIGSRPSKRPGQRVDVNALRAIPWVLCWTQTRVLMPAWWGIGQAWRSTSASDQIAMKEAFASNPFLSSFVKTLGFTLAKVELDIWKLYFRKNKDAKLFTEFDHEYKDSVRFVQEMSQHKELIWHKPWLQESIRLRSSNIHILNLLQILALENSDEALLKETLVGIACGMMTTG